MSTRFMRGFLVAVTICAALTIRLSDTAGASWSPSENVAGIGQSVLWGSQVGVDGSGTAYAAWVESRWPSSTDRLWLRERPAGSSWGAPVQVPTGSASVVRSLVMNVNDGGDVLLAFTDIGLEYALRRPAGGSWDAAKTWNSPGTAGPASGCALAPAISQNDDGIAVIAWTSYQSCNGVVSRWRVMAAAFDPDTGWEPASHVWGVSPSDVHSNPAVTVDGNGHATVAFQARTGNFPPKDDLWTAEWEGSWTAPTLRSDAGSSVMLGDPAVASRGGVTAITWQSGNSTFVMKRQSSVWAAFPAYSAANAGNSEPPGVAVDASGAVYATRTTTTGSANEVRFTTIPASGSTSDIRLSDAGTSASSSTVAVNAFGDLVAAWDVSNGGHSAAAKVRPLGAAWPATATTITLASSSSSDGGTTPSVAIGNDATAVVGATPVTGGMGTEFDVAVETHTPFCARPKSGAWIGSLASTVSQPAGSSDATLLFSSNDVSGIVNTIHGTTATHTDETLNGTISCSTVTGSAGSLAFAGSIAADGRRMTVTYTDGSDTGTWTMALVEEVTSTVGTSLTTDAGSTGATPLDPVQVGIVTPNSGALSISVAATAGGQADGYSLLGKVVHIDAPDATPEAPHALTFEADASVTGGAPASSVAAFRNGQFVMPCSDASGTADPDPCVSARLDLPNGNVQITILTSRASVWALGTPASVSIGSASVVEGDSPLARKIAFPVNLSDPSTSTVTVQYTVQSDGSIDGATAPSDFKARVGKVTFKPNATTGLTDTSKAISVLVYSDSAPEPDETFRVVLSAPTGGYSVGNAIGTGTVIDDDPVSGLRVSVGNQSVWEGDRAPVKKFTKASVALTLSAPAPGPLTVKVTILNGSASPGSDYKVVKAKTVKFNTGQWQKHVPVTIYPDVDHETDETILVQLSDASTGLSLGRSVGTITVLNED